MLKKLHRIDPAKALIRFLSKNLIPTRTLVAMEKKRSLNLLVRNHMTQSHQIWHVPACTFMGLYQIP